VGFTLIKEVTGVGGVILRASSLSLIGRIYPHQRSYGCRRCDPKSFKSKPHRWDLPSSKKFQVKEVWFKELQVKASWVRFTLIKEVTGVVGVILYRCCFQWVRAMYIWYYLQLLDKEWLRCRDLFPGTTSSRWEPGTCTATAPPETTTVKASVLTLTLTSESVYGSQFFHCKLLQVLMS
jgi:hypothetical protein